MRGLSARVGTGIGGYVAGHQDGTTTGDGIAADGAVTAITPAQRLAVGGALTKLISASVCSKHPVVDEYERGRWKGRKMAVSSLARVACIAAFTLLAVADLRAYRGVTTVWLMLPVAPDVSEIHDGISEYYGTQPGMTPFITPVVIKGVRYEKDKFKNDVTVLTLMALRPSLLGEPSFSEKLQMSFSVRSGVIAPEAVDVGRVWFLAGQYTVGGPIISSQDQIQLFSFVRPAGWPEGRRRFVDGKNTPLGGSQK